MRPRWKHAARPVGFVYVLIPSIIPARRRLPRRRRRCSYYIHYTLIIRYRVYRARTNLTCLRTCFFFFFLLLYFLRFQSDSRIPRDFFFLRETTEIRGTRHRRALAVNKTGPRNTTNDETADRVKRFFYLASSITADRQWN